VVRVPAEPEIAGVQVIGQEALAELVDQVVLVGLAARVASVALANRVALAARVAPVALANQVALAARVAPVALANQVALAVRVALPLRTRSATAAHHRGLVRVPVAEDLAAAAETTRERAAVEAVAAWVVAG
jgi:hypothetical protein